MNHKKFSIISMVLAVAIGLSACTSPVTQAATSEAQAAMPEVQVTAPAAQACATAEPQTCPTPALQAAEVNDWRWNGTKNQEFVITIDPGDKCSIENIDSYDGAGLGWDIVVNDQTYQNYMVIALSLGKGKTLKDLQDYTDKTGGKLVAPPPWSKIETTSTVSPMTRTSNGTNIDVVPLYFVCAIQGPDEERIIGVLEGNPIRE